MTGSLIDRNEVVADPLKFHGLNDGIVTSTARHGDKITMLTILTPRGEWNIAVREVAGRSPKTEIEAEKAYARRLIDALRTHGRMIAHHLGNGS